jgi:uncharacterized protein
MSDKTTSDSKHTNRLAQESSPYLLQHAHNPVNWYAWGPEAFEKARKEDKPIFLSVGYSTCYWCHVMERESFENEAIAAEMNRLFVSIKVDREERPDVDQLYMTAVQLLTRHGGWPMSVWLTPDLRPFYGGTYFPPQNFVGYLRALEDAYRNRRDEVDKTSEQITAILQRLARPSAPDKPLDVDLALIESLIDRSIADYDPHHGGFGAAPKFPRETLLELLLVYLAQPTSSPNQRRSGIQKKLRHTLDAMAAGGIRDHLGGGFHRYSTDAQWLVPHFEIMLYDNAMLGWVYAEAYRQTREERYATVARGIFDFVLRQMTSPGGGFFTAFDAEVDAKEGLSYLWTREEIESILGAEDAKLFNDVYGVTRGPNFADPHHGNGTPDKSILYLPRPLAEVAGEMKLDPAALEARLAPMRQKLYDIRRQRKQPLLDTKIITSWNALMIRALANGGGVFKEKRYLDAATKASNFLLKQHRAADGKIYRTSREGKPKQGGFLDDYAFFAQALLALAEATADTGWKKHAANVAVSMLQRFVDEERGGFFFTAAEAKDLLVRQKTAQDSPLPSGNAVATMALLELGQTKGCVSVLAAFAQQMADQGESMSSMVQAALLYLQKAEQFTVSASEEGNSADRPASPDQIAAGVVSASVEWHNAAELWVRLNVLAGFHINAHETGGDMPLISTTLTADAAGAAIDYPPGEQRQFSFSAVPIRVYTGEVIIRVQFSIPLKPESQVRLALSYQACDETACFPAVTKQMEVEAPSIH